MPIQSPSLSSVYDALRVLKEFCNARCMCDNCPFTDKKDECVLSFNGLAPGQMDINQPNATFRFLND